jgi:hypothetical protein
MFCWVSFSVDGEPSDAAAADVARGVAAGFGCDRDAAAERLPSGRTGLAARSWDGLTVISGRV